MRKIINSEQFISDYKSGMTLKAMGLKYGVSAPTIAHYALKKFGLSPRGRGNRKVMFFENKKDV
jgi:hypothetical protein